MDSVPRRPCSPWCVGLAVGVAALAVYATTCCRGVNWQDSGVHQYRILTGQVENIYGLALSHPLHHWLGRGVAALTGGSPFALNLMSSVFGAVALGLIAGFVASLTGRGLAGLLAGLTAGLAHAFWQMSVLTETYTLQAALLAAEWCILLAYCRRGRPVWLVLLFGVNGLHISNHLLGLLALATYGVLLLERVFRGGLRPGWLAAVAGAWLLGAAPYITLVVQHYLRVGDLAATLSSALFGVGTMGTGFRQRVLEFRPPLAVLVRFVVFFGYSVPSLALLLAVLGVLRPPSTLPRPLYRVLLGQSLLFLVFVARYRIEDIFTFFLPLCALVGVWVGFAAAFILNRTQPAAARRAIGIACIAHAILPVAVYIGVPLVAAQRGLFDRSWRDIPFRDDYSWFFHPWKQHDDSAEQFARATLEKAEPGAWILSDATVAYPIALLELAGVGREKRLVMFSSLDCVNDRSRPRLTAEMLASFLRSGGRVLAVPSWDLEQLWSKHFRITPDGIWCRLSLPNAAAVSQPDVGRDP